MQTTPPASPIPVPEIESDAPVTVIPAASVAPLDGAPDGARINTFALAQAEDGGLSEDLMAAAREHVLDRPLTCVAVAFSLGLLIGRLLR